MTGSKEDRSGQIQKYEQDGHRNENEPTAKDRQGHGSQRQRRADKRNPSAGLAPERQGLEHIELDHAEKEQAPRQTFQELDASQDVDGRFHGHKDHLTNDECHKGEHKEDLPAQAGGPEIRQDPSGPQGMAQVEE